MNGVMSALDHSETLAEPLPAGLVEAGTYASARDGAEHGLVVLALGFPYWLTPGPAGHHLFVEPEVAPRAATQLAAYDRERISWPPPPIVDPWSVRRSAFITPLLWAFAVLALYHFPPPWAPAGVLDARALFDRGEWWRPATALFLHGDPGHVISNALGGILIFCAVLSTLGRWRGGVLLALGAVMGNVAVAAANYPGPYRSLGASTAIFAGVGLLTGRAVRVVARTRHPHRWRAMFVPFAAGLTVFALHGAGGQRVDVGAHLAGFLVGLFLGFVVGLDQADRRGKEARVGR